MLTLHLTHEPQWIDVLPGVRLRLRPLTTALMIAARSDPLMTSLSDDAPAEDRALAFARAVARRAIVEWSGIVDYDGSVVSPTPETIDRVLDVWPIFEAFQRLYISRALLLEQEKNVYGASPSGTSAEAANIVQPAEQKNAPSVQGE